MHRVYLDVLRLIIIIVVEGFFLFQGFPICVFIDILLLFFFLYCSVGRREIFINMNVMEKHLMKCNKFSQNKMEKKKQKEQQNNKQEQPRRRCLGR